MQLSDIIRRAIEIGERKGFVTFDELNEICPATCAPEDIEQVMEALSDAGIRVEED
ncbi:RNA polymerase sigma factor region1.1 domain-containing protein [Bradyrhizobium sp. HKCCYLRH3099]|uniref:RNA polymerase sigma factor region1.1 domain-containing protein n=1 Tax=unclassified Bradyrhizobium TaxID=2631580 RepID=UPI003EC1014D